MKTWKKIVICVAVLLSIPLIAALFIKNEYSVQREITINKPKHHVFNYIRYQKNQDNYSKWVMMDPTMKKEYRGIDGTVGFVYAWDGNEDAGKGEQEIKKIKDGELVDMEVRFIRPFAGIATTNMTTQALSETSTAVKWNFNSRMNYPLNIMMVFFDMDEMLGNDMESGLVKLKNILEKQ